MTDVAKIELTDFIRSIPDFPKPGILFRDITPLLSHGPAFRQAIRTMADPYRGANIDVIAAAEARGFIFAAPLAVELGCGFVPIRKPGKLPYKTISGEYELEYGTDSLHIHADGVHSAQRVLLVDDLLATGGTMATCCKLVETIGAAVVGCAFLIELAALGGAEKLGHYPYTTVLKY